MLSTTSQYALRALACLARSPHGDAMLGRELSAEAQVPGNYLSKIMLTMRNAGLVQATRGAGGGYRLANDPGAIRLIDVVALFEGDGARPECVLGNNICSDRTACAAHARWRSVRQQYLEFLEGTTIGDIAGLMSEKPSR